MVCYIRQKKKKLLTGPNPEAFEVIHFIGQILYASFLKKKKLHVNFIVVKSLNCVRFFATPHTAAHQAFLSFPVSQSLLKFMSFELVMQSNHLILFCPLLFPPSIFPRIRVFSIQSALRIRWPKHWSVASASVLPMNIQG